MKSDDTAGFNPTVTYNSAGIAYFLNKWLKQ